LIRVWYGGHNYRVTFWLECGWGKVGVEPEISSRLRYTDVGLPFTVTQRLDWAAICERFSERKVRLRNISQAGNF
jgi:hypothetical protein